MPAGRTARGRTGRMPAVTGVLAVLGALAGFTLTACQAEQVNGRAPASPSEHRSASAAPTPDPGASPAWDTDPDSLAAVGDSITRAFDACGPLADCPKASWATGTAPNVDSLAQRLLDRPSRDSWNLAESGAAMADVREQMARAAVHDPELVTVMAGANDACGPSADAMTPVAAFRADFEEALRTLWQEAPGAQVYVAGIPDLKRLWEIGRGNPEAEQVWAFGICPSMLRAPQATGDTAVARRNRVSDRVEAYNAVLRDVCSAERRCRWDGGAVHEYRFTADALSRWDWFHPSREGQSDLAELAYERITDR